jgi:hypothetical protein
MHHCPLWILDRYFLYANIWCRNEGRGQRLCQEWGASATTWHDRLLQYTDTWLCHSVYYYRNFKTLVQTLSSLKIIRGNPQVSDLHFWTTNFIRNRFWCTFAVHSLGTSMSVYPLWPEFPSFVKIDQALTHTIEIWFEQKVSFGRKWQRLVTW